MMETPQGLALAQVSRHLAAAQIFRIVQFYGRAGRSITAKQSRHARLVIRAAFTFGLVIQDHDAHRRASITSYGCSNRSKGSNSSSRSLAGSSLTENFSHQLRVFNDVFAQFRTYGRHLKSFGLCHLFLHELQAG